MGAIASLDDFINRTTGGGSGNPQQLVGFKVDRVAGAAPANPISGRYSSLWQYGGSNGPGAAPGAVAAPTNATNGSLKQTNPSGGRELWSTARHVASTQPGAILLYDRLLHISGLSGTVTTAQTVGGSLTRNTNGGGNEIWVEVYTQIGASSTTITASYTDQDGNAGQTTEAVAIGNTGLREAQRIIRLPLAAGDSGVRAVASVTLAATTGTAGDFGVTIARPLGLFQMGSAGRSDVDSRIIKIDDNACLAFAYFASGVTPPFVAYDFSFVEA